MDPEFNEKNSSRRLYIFNSIREIPANLHDDWRRERWIHNRRFLRISSAVTIIAVLFMTIRRFYMEDASNGTKLDYLFFVNFAVLGGFSLLYLTSSLIFSRQTYSQVFEYSQRIVSVVFLVLFSFLGYLDMQVAPDFAAIFTVVIFLSVAFWIDLYTYLFYLAIIALLAVLNFRIGLHLSIAGNELLMEVGLYMVVGLVMYYAVNEMRTRSFVTSRQLENSIHELRELSLRDPLTRLYNRRMMNDELDRETSFSRRTGQTLTIMLIDIDHFKRVNDSFGHTVGDEVLQKCASRLLDIVRESDRVYRFGGEEFILLLPNTSLSSSESLATRLLSGFSDVLFSGVPWPITISMGVADNTERSIPADLIKLADSRMYAAKQAGRNRFVCDGFTDSNSEEPLIP